jgi:hypothetical protein
MTDEEPRADNWRPLAWAAAGCFMLALIVWVFS